ncbi:uncharacterized protein YegJ (DUF2314 family) [Bradyrhizobium sp. R2.2-H]|jgi:uncharacterized protein YegJ (DUF2314 family)|uniref:YegJ family protein n=1 Tax=unclassified Bradyrhizobium TaxID=2631580 RepID=UPI0010486C7C|nr:MULTISPECIES: DUF2314 domain-containing protein [unclassified Bradyrhizobium]TCU73706.1 uncharacterized protein YegJ (DUF2314 family) [Bradyrhizobium sp. Y-H1]TCU76104.1 uncharacterized protein YegJ (DUF2314 family) [Bradyrhizobium sp. R2.2-H]
MATKLSQPIKWVVLAAITGVSVFGILTIGPTHEVVAQDRSPIVTVQTADPEMNAAIERGRATLPTFWASYVSPKPSETGHALKVRFSTRKGGEHIWVGEVKKQPDGTFTGLLANEPRDLPGKHAGDKVSFGEADVSDWMFTRNGKIVGGETIKPTLKSLPKADADAIRARMEQP